jgi:hypothetical protein
MYRKYVVEEEERKKRRKYEKELEESIRKGMKKGKRCSMRKIGSTEWRNNTED